jgi:hypothetical protein
LLIRVVVVDLPKQLSPAQVEGAEIALKVGGSVRFFKSDVVAFLSVRPQSY